ncbi:serine hydrolase [Actinorhabdospora filicis]|uniref:Serine hydrolase n=1 Tax=Actinorhabdospora filicis TaxID=1785913 RepID=A0A9W6SMX3_9ACTN|nr:serine hydrolase domain-containing protein [Actinorhabdospora filicis]GLZ78825.1 serine hydrolase [Actinorhabdospora filicis]
MGQRGFTEAGLRRVRRVLTRHVESGKIPGLVALLGRGDHTHVEAIGTMRHDGGPPMRRDTIFRMASASKPVTTAGAMILLDECRLRLDEPVDAWLPELAARRVLARPDGPLDDTVPAERPITVRDLLTSTFGLGVDFELMTAPIRAATFAATDYSVYSGPAPEPGEWMRRLGELPLSHQPGRRWQYDLAIEVLGVLIARVAGTTLEEFLRERLFTPLGMNDTGFHVPAEKIDRLPPLYGPDPATGEFHVWDQARGGRSSTPPAFQGAGGGLVSTADDYHAYFRMLLGHGQPILSRPAVELMTTDRLSPQMSAARQNMYRGIAHIAQGMPPGGWGFGMGVHTRRDGYVPAGQFGWDGGTGTSAYADPGSGLVGVLLTQVGMSTPDSTRVIQDFWTTAHQALA